MKRFTLFNAMIGGMVCTLLLMSGCNGGNDGKSQSTQPTITCASFNGNQNECEKNSESGKRCVYDTASKTCAQEGNQELCGKLGDEECKDEAKCWLDTTANKCIPIGNRAGTCEAHQREATCDADAACQWDGDECVKKAQATDIFTWKKVTNLPEDIAKISAVKVSLDQQNIYFYRDADDVAERGIFHSGDNGQTWARLAEKEKGILKGFPFLGRKRVGVNPTQVTLDTKSIKPSLYATQNGIVVHSGTKLLVIENSKVIWAIDTTNHNETHFRLGPYYFNFTKNVKNEPIVFARVVTTHAGESVIFGQQSANTVFMHKVDESASTTSAPIHFKTKNEDGTDLNEVWTMAGNTYNNEDILLASDHGVYEFPKANTDHTVAADFGKATADSPVLFPEPAGANVNWVDNNVQYRFVGSFNNNGTPHYFASLIHDAASGRAGGFAHHNGAQKAGEHAELILENHNTMGVGINYVGQPRISIDEGYRGINNDGTLNPANDLDLKTYAADKNHMQEDKSAVEAFTDVDNQSAILLGNPNKTYLWIINKALYIITKSQGTPRP